MSANPSQYQRESKNPTIYNKVNSNSSSYVKSSVNATAWSAQSKNKSSYLGREINNLGIIMDDENYQMDDPIGTMDDMKLQPLYAQGSLWTKT